MPPQIMPVEVTGRDATITWLQEPVELDNTVDNYFITVTTTPNRCEAESEDFTLNGALRSFVRGNIEEDSEIIISITASNTVGESLVSVNIQTPTDGKESLK